MKKNMKLVPLPLNFASSSLCWREEIRHHRDLLKIKKYIHEL